MHICTQEHSSHCIQKKIIVNSFVLSLVQCSSVLLATINQNITTTLEKQLNLAIKASFHRQKFGSSSDLKMNIGILPISLVFDYRAATYCDNITNKKKPAFWSSALKLSIASFYIHERTQNFFTQTTSKCNLHEKSFFKKVFSSTIPSQEIIRQCHTVLQRRKLNSFFLMNTRRTRRKPNMFQLLGNILSSIKFLSALYWIYVTVVPLRQYKWLLYSGDILFITNY